MLSPIPIERFAASACGAAGSEFFPSDAYTSASFHDFELGAIWHKEWISVGRAEEIPRVGDYFSITIGREPLLLVRSTETEIVALSPICRHRGMLVAEGSGHCRGVFVCPYHGWSYDLQGKLRGAPQMAGRLGFEISRIALPRLRVELWQGMIFVNFDAHAAPLAPRLRSLDALMESWGLRELRGEFQLDPNYRMSFDCPWNWKVYSEGQSECYHCDKLHGTTPIMRNLDLSSMTMEVEDAQAGVWAFSLRGKSIDPTINQFGKAVLPPIPTLSEAQRYINYAVTIAPNIFMALMADSVIVLNWMPLGPQTMKVKRHRLYPQATLAMPEFVELHRPESAAAREFVGQDDYAFERVQAGLNSIFAPRGPIAPREPVLVGFNQWLVDRYRRADAAARAPAAT